MDEPTQSGEDESTAEEEQQRLTAQEEEYARVHRAVHDAEENVKALMVFSMLLIVTQQFLWAALGVFVFAVIRVVPYYTMWAIATLAHWKLHSAHRNYSHASFCTAMAAGIILGCLYRASISAFDCLAYDEATRWYTPTGSHCAFEVWFVALLTAGSNLILLGLCALIAAQYRALGRDYPRMLELGAEVKKTKSQ